jgi:hypothetical protein
MALYEAYRKLTSPPCCFPFSAAKRVLQDQVFAENFSLTSEPSAQRAAHAIAAFLEQQAGAAIAPAQ